MVTFTPDGKQLLVANEGEPSATARTGGPGGIRSASSTVRGLGNVKTSGQCDVGTAGFDSSTAARPQLIRRASRIYGPGATVAQDLEPEYITVSADPSDGVRHAPGEQRDRRARPRDGDGDAIRALGFEGPQPARPTASTPSDRDDAVDIATLAGATACTSPTAIASYHVQGADVPGRRPTRATRGSGRVRRGGARVSRGYALDPAAFPNAAALKTNAALAG